MKDFAITIKFQVTDTQLFEEYFVLFKNWIKTETDKYSWSIEKDDTIDRHIHAYVIADFVDGDKLKRRITTKEFLPFMKKFKGSNSLLPTAIVCKAVTKTPLYSLGYTQKWHCRRRGHYGFTDQEIIDAVEYYYVTTRLEKSQDVSDDWKLVNIKNFHAHVEDFVKKNPELKFQNSELIKLRMVEHGYSFLGLSSKQEEKGFREIRIRREASSEKDKNVTSLEASGLEGPSSFDKLMEEDIKDLFRYLLANATGDKKIPDNIFSIYKRYEHLSDY